MSGTVISVENLTKEYRLGTISHGTLHHDVQSWWARMRGKEDPNSIISVSPHRAPDGDEHFLALNDVSFEVERGEVLGIIGRNGAGKSTLLKILSRVTAPTKGTVRLNGRVASLLEVGTGFHPELTGRENIYINGAILGMTRKEIGKKFDEIVAFSEVERFIDTPVKRYSSGMYVRLAFAVAAHLDPEILIIDEVLAVGDAQFQKKCMGKMGDVARGGRTVLFVSHNMAAVENLCQRAILLKNGRLTANGETNAVLKKYIDALAEASGIPLLKRTDRSGNGEIRFSSVLLQSENGEDVKVLLTGRNVKMIFLYENYKKKNLKNLCFAVGIDNHLGHRITVLNNENTGEIQEVVPAEANKIEISIERLPLMPGRYSFTIFCKINGIIADWIQDAGFFYVESGDFFNSGKLPMAGQGDFLIKHHFSPIEKDAF